jgi:CheY-like chemotaxis protein
MAGDLCILLVDDDFKVLNLLTRALRSGGFQVTATTSGKEALDLLGQQNFHAMVLDLNMPKPDGFEILKVARAHAPSLKIVVISGFMQGPLLEAALLVGGAATLAKPVDPKELVRTVRDVLANTD